MPSAPPADARRATGPCPNPHGATCSRAASCSPRDPPLRRQQEGSRHSSIECAMNKIAASSAGLQDPRSRAAAGVVLCRDAQQQECAVGRQAVDGDLDLFLVN